MQIEYTRDSPMIEKTQTQPIVIAAFYKFVHLPDYQDLRYPLQDFCRARDMKGSILLAEEGINGTISGPRADMDAVLAYLRADERLADLLHKESFADAHPFSRMKVRLKREIVTLGVDNADPLQKVGTYIDPEEWNTLISDPDVILVDTRNDYEVEVGTFKGAIDPQIASFGQFPQYVQANLDPQKHKKVAMFCTGGIRCEKATAYLLDLGFEEVYHLRGGILRYLEEMPEDKTLWEGECFVFDQRISVDHQLKVGEAWICRECDLVVKSGDFCPNCGE